MLIFALNKLYTLGALILKGVVTGLILSIMLGPAFFLLLETSIRKGIKAALAFDAGVLVSDIIYIIIAYVFYQEVSDFANGENNAIIKLIGGILFLVYGALTFLKQPKEQKKDDSGNVIKTNKIYAVLFTKGLVLNLANPLVVFYWFSVLALGANGNNNADLKGIYMFIYIVVILVTFFGIDLLKIVGAKELRPFITNNVLRSLNRVTGSILFIFGVFLVVQSAIIMMM